MSELDQLVRKQLPPGWIDLAVGEARIVRNALLQIYPSDVFKHGPMSSCDYQSPAGYAPLVELLEGRHNRKVVVTSGAKQALTAVFYAIQQKNIAKVTMAKPWWSQMPAAAKLVGLNVCFSESPIQGYAHLLVAPSNPDGRMPSSERIALLARSAQINNHPYVHDAAYYAETYIDGDLPELAPTTIYSASKMFGLSGLRVGYVTTNDEFIYEKVKEYVETSTVGVSLLSQQMFYNIMRVQERDQDTHFCFTASSRAMIARAKKLMLQVPKNVLDTSGATDAVGMFGWFRKGPDFDSDAARVAVADGLAFGDHEMVRLNLAEDYNVLQKAVDRLCAKKTRKIK